MAENQMKVFTDESLTTFVDEVKAYTDNSVNDVAVRAAYIDNEDNENVNITEGNTNTSIVVDSALSTTSANPVQNKVITNKINELSQEIIDLKENGGGSSVQPDYAQTDRTQPDYIKNKLVGKEVTYSDTLTWDGNTDGLESVDLGDGAIVYFISEAVTTTDIFANGHTVIATNDNGDVNDVTSFCPLIAVSDMFGIYSDGVYALGEAGFVITKDNAVAEDETMGIHWLFPKKGLYVTRLDFYMSSLTIKGFSGFPTTTTTKKLTAEYLEPFEVVTKGGDTLTWDGDTSGKTVVEIPEANGGYVLLTEATPTKDELLNGAVINVISISTGENLQTVTVDDEMAIVTAIPNALVVGGCVIITQMDNIDVDGLIMPKKGTYFMFSGAYDMRAADITIPNYTGFTTTEKKLKGEYLSQPDFNQNDSSKPDYIKNRPFYSEEAVLFNKNDISFDNSMGMLAAVISPVSFALGDGTYSVDWDGQTYECESVFIDGMYAVGNVDSLTTGADNGLPFVIMIGDMGDGTLAAAIYDINGTMNGATEAMHNVSLSGDVAIPIDEKYIPNSIKGADWDAEEGSAKHIKNRPCCKNRLVKEIEWDGDITDKEVVQIYTDDTNGEKVYLCKVEGDQMSYSNYCVDIEECESDNAISITNNLRSNNYVWFREGQINMTSKNVGCVLSTNSNSKYIYNLLGRSLSYGIWIAFCEDNAGNITKYVKTCKMYTVSTLYDFYLPRRIFADSIILQSSDGSKYFKVIVDNDGTLAATEYTNG